MLDQNISIDCQPMYQSIVKQLSTNHQLRCQPACQQLYWPQYQPPVPIIEMIWYFYNKSFDCHQELAVDHHEVILRCSSSSVLSQQNLKKLYLGILRHKEKIIIGTKQFVLEEILLSFGYDVPYRPWCKWQTTEILQNILYWQHCVKNR